MNSDSEIAAYGNAFEDAARFDRVLIETEREEVGGLEELLHLEYGDDSAVLYALGEADRIFAVMPPSENQARDEERL